MTTFTLNLPSTLKFNEQEFEQLALANRESQLELTATGELIIMPPTGGETGHRNFEMNGQFWLWNQNSKLGKAFDSSTGFQLPNGAKRSPDLSWISLEKWNALTPQQRRIFLPLCPDFVVELVSESDELKTIQAKMQEYLDNGLRLGWLIFPKKRLVEIYRPQQPIELLRSPTQLSGENVLPNFILDLSSIWEI